MAVGDSWALRLHRLPRYPRWWRVLSDRESVARYLALREPLASERDESGAVEVRVRALGGKPVLLRPGTSDWKVLGETFRGRYHLPPEELVGSGARRILDLGANIGLTMAHFAVLYPDARVVGIEIDAANATLARANVAAWGGRCSLLESAVWTNDGTVRYTIEPGNEYSASIEMDGREVPAVSLETLLDENGAPVDYVKMDIEGAERDVLRLHTGWADRVRCLKVEVHGPSYTVPECVADLETLGFSTSVALDHFGAVLAWRS
jgi:FkbM family methyltransferase